MAPRGSSHRRRLAATVATGAVLTALAGCGATAPTRTDSSTVVAAFYPWAWLTRQIAGDALEVQDLTGPGVDPHDVELTARQVVDIERATLLVYVKGIQPAVDDTVEQHAEDHALDAGSVVDVLPAAETAGTEAHEGEHGHAGEREGGHQPASLDPHIWLDPVRFAAVAKELRDRLVQLDPAHADGYQRRTDRLVRTLDELHEAYRSGLRSCSDRTIVTSHESFGYLADRYDLEQVGVAGLDPNVPPSPARMVEVARLIEASNVEVVFLERLASPKVATTLARETGARTAVLDNIEGVRSGSSEEYLSLMRGNLSTLREALRCA